ncbi:hypothetical protein NG701_05200 [Pseudarthrobacter sp. HLT3-5]|uniref:hypothetical protein n=1 Tax=Pseudarthrobacter cellobiosi TaxID=2953654 RepID=UPI00208FD2FF|nr:hypothetical protein [Pseudarthrobacter sp. HLT3-5]MCO4273831.1 hypothetical protein [Pseudarthrobacter sp. HLT3-5]
MPSPIIGRPVSAEVWESIRAEFTLPTVEQVRRRLAELMEDPDPVMRQIVRVFIREDTYCPGFQFLPGGQIHPTVASLFRHALELKIAHNYFTVWMITPSATVGGARPVDSLPRSAQLHRALEGFAAQPPETRRAQLG